MAQTITNSQVGIGGNNEEDESQKPAGSSQSNVTSSNSPNSNIVGASGGTSSMGSSNMVGAGSQPASNQPQATGQAAQQGSGFVNLQKIIGANQNNNLGNTISNDLNNSTSQAKSGIQNAQNTFNTDSNQYNYNTSQNQNDANNVINGVVNSTSTPNVSPSEQSQFGTWINGTYGGPSNLSTVNAGLQNQVNNVTGLAKQGNIGLLQNYLGGQNYTAGDQNLDNVLLNATGGTQVQQAKNNAANLSNQYNQANNAATMQAQNIQQGNQAFSGQLLGNLGSNFQNIYGNAQNQANTDTGQVNSLYGDISNFNPTTGQGLSATDLGAIGLNNGQTIYNANLGSYENSTNPTVTAQQAMTPQQLAQLQALSSLGNGQLNSNITNQIAGDTSSNVGTYGLNNYYNQGALQSYLTGAQNSLNALANPTLADLNHLNSNNNAAIDNGQATGGYPGISSDETTLQNLIKSSGYNNVIGGAPATTAGQYQGSLQNINAGQSAGNGQGASLQDVNNLNYQNSPQYAAAMQAALQQMSAGGYVP